MTKLRATVTAFVAAMTMATAVVLAQPATAPVPSGHWEGTIDVPGNPLAVQIDLAKTGDTWEGTIAVPAQGLKGYPLGGLQLSAQKVAFAITGAPGNPAFSGDVSPDGQSITGNFSQGGGSTTFNLKRTGDAKIEPPPKSTPIAKELEGNWEGTIDVSGKTLHLMLKLENQAKGATGSMISVDQGNAQIPITAVVQAGTHLTVTLRPINGTFEGDLKDGQLVGTWTQGPSSLPLTFTRPK